MARYHPIMIILHWLLAVMIILALVMGTFSLSEMDNADPAKIGALRMHMGVGLAILALMIVRLITRRMTQNPPEFDSGNARADTAGRWMHRGLYVFVILLALSGMALGNMAGLGEIVFFGADRPLPADFFEFAPRFVHGILSKLVGLLVILHILAALKHLFIDKDTLMDRMRFKTR